ncbi:peptidylprolyl isomerase [Massilia sp. CFBP9026]|uniref:peptidylprolyl isomerase n=1 Tax=Massilia sp. CFBP9026 TaxID=3096536 RepID=UPI002A6ADDD0|nr:peptidylprolyl isomerase [Massilia sp. CFBP9026]MDY0961384.1 peptidylprolyl isomerase [Massilia sp. CFBP9026]
MKAATTIHAITGMALVALLAHGAGAAPAGSGKELPPKPSVADVVKASKPGDWRPLDPENTLYMELPAGRVVMELAPNFAPKAAANIRALVRERYFDGLWIMRAQDGFVVQWGDPDEETPRPFKATKTVDAEFTVPAKGTGAFTQLRERDVYAPQVGHVNGFPVARDPKGGQAWLPHCYAMVGVARDEASNTGNGSQLYTVIGHAPRHLDRNITVVGRIVAGMPLLTVMPRGTGALGFYEKAEQRTSIATVRLAADVPAAERSKLEVMRTESAAFQAVIEAQRNRGGPWTKVAAGAIDLCNVPIPVREQQ